MTGRPSPDLGRTLATVVILLIAGGLVGSLTPWGAVGGIVVAAIIGAVYILVASRR